MLHVAHLVLDELPGALHEAGEHAHTIDEQAAVGRMMDGGLHAGGIQPKLASFGHPGLSGQLHHPVNQRMHRLWSQGLLPAPQRTGIGHLMEGHPAEPAQHQAVGHPPLAFFVAPLVEVFEDQHAQQHFHWRRVPTMHQSGAIALAKVGSHLLVQRVIVEQAVQLPEHRIDLVCQLGHLGEDIFSRVAVH